MAHLVPNFYNFLHYFRLFGLVLYSTFQCDDISYPSPVPTWFWPEYLNPILIFSLYFLISMQISIKRDQDESLYLDDMSLHYFGPIIVESDEKVRRKLPLVTLNSKPDTPENPTGSETHTEIPRISLRQKFSGVIVQKLSRISIISRVSSLPGETVWRFVQSKSYVLSLVTMVLWSLCYHSWSTFVLLIASCLIWMNSGRGDEGILWITSTPALNTPGYTLARL